MESEALTFENRVVALERQMINMRTTVTNIQNDIQGVKDDTATIRQFVVGTTRVGIFFKKHGPRIIAFGLGCAVAGGWLSPESFERLKTALGYFLS